MSLFTQLFYLNSESFSTLQGQPRSLHLLQPGNIQEESRHPKDAAGADQVPEAQVARGKTEGAREGEGGRKEAEDAGGDEAEQAGG